VLPSPATATVKVGMLINSTPTKKNSRAGPTIFAKKV